jgi:hypothetical protein
MPIQNRSAISWFRQSNFPELPFGPSAVRSDRTLFAKWLTSVVISVV